jgi:hypothetical protein
MSYWTELRKAHDQECYTKAQILDYYESDGEFIWNQLPIATDLDKAESHRIRQMRQRDEDDQMRNPGWTVRHGIWQPNSTTPGVIAPTTPGVVAATPSRNIDAHQLDVSRNSDAPVIPTTVSSRNIDAHQPDADETAPRLSPPGPMMPLPSRLMRPPSAPGLLMPLPNVIPTTVSSRNSDALALMPHAMPQAAAAPALMPPVVFTCDQLKAMPSVPQHAGKFAWAKQKELRELLLESGTYEHDLTQSDWPWRDVIRSLPKNEHEILVGPGVIMFTFYLVPGEIDQNYHNKTSHDSGERHVFHVRRKDNVAHHLHYHSNGTHDDPVKSQHTISVHKTFPGKFTIRQQDFSHMASYNGALQPVGFDEGSITGANVGRNEAGEACTTLLEACGVFLRPVAVDVTDELAFSWRRWLKHQRNTVKIQAMPHDIVKVFICRSLFVVDQHIIACCRTDRTYVCFYPKLTPRSGQLPIHHDWPEMDVFQHPYHISVPWNRVPDRA